MIVQPVVEPMEHYTALLPGLPAPAAGGDHGRRAQHVHLPGRQPGAALPAQHRQAGVRCGPHLPPLRHVGAPQVLKQNSQYNIFCIFYAILSSCHSFQVKHKDKDLDIHMSYFDYFNFHF